MYHYFLEGCSHLQVYLIIKRKIFDTFRLHLIDERHFLVVDKVDESTISDKINTCTINANRHRPL